MKMKLDFQSNGSSNFGQIICPEKTSAQKSGETSPNFAQFTQQKLHQQQQQQQQHQQQQQQQQMASASVKFSSKNSSFKSLVQYLSPSSYFVAASLASSKTSSFINMCPKSNLTSLMTKLFVIFTCVMLFNSISLVECGRTRNSSRNRAHRLGTSKKLKNKNSPIYYIKSNSFFNSRPLLTELLMNSHTSSAALSTLSNALSSGHYTRMSSSSSSSSSASSSSSSYSSSSSSSSNRPLVVSTMYRLPIKYLSNAKPTDVYKVSKKKNKNKNKVVSWKDPSNFVTSPTTSSPTTMTTTTTTTTTTEKSYPPAPVYFKDRKKKRKQHLTESKMYYMPFKSNGQPNLKSLLDTMAQSGLFDSSGVKGGKKKRKNNSYNGNFY